MNRLALLALAACGGSNATPDATPPDAVESTGSVTVMVKERGNPVAGLPVLFVSSDTTFTAVTSIEGSSGKNMSSGGSVTVLFPKNRYGIDKLMTFVDVEMGDLLLVELDARGPDAQRVGVTVTDTANTDPYVLYTTCGGEEPFGLSLGNRSDVTMECPTGGKVDLLAMRLDPNDNHPISSAFLADVSFNTDVTLSNFTPIQNLGVTYTNASTFDFVATTQITSTATHGRLFESFTSGNPQTQGTDPIPPVVRPMNAGMRTVLASTAFPRATDLDEQVLYTTTDISAGSIAISMDARLPPYGDQQTVMDKPPIVGVFQNTTLVWKEGPANNTSDFVRAKIRVYRDDIPQGTAWTWQIAGKRGPKAEIVFPTLATPMFEALGPIASDVVTVEELTNVKLPGGFTKAARENGFSDVNSFMSFEANKTMIVERRFMHEPGCVEPPCN